jgi:DNA-binding XRE family transcriptional regulator
MKPQIIKSESGEELIVLPRRAYEELVAARDDEDIAAARLLRRAEAALASGGEVVLPGKVAEAIARGARPIKVMREWRGLTQAQLGKASGGLTQGYISQLESGASEGTPKALRAIAKALRVPVGLLVAG